MRAASRRLRPVRPCTAGHRPAPEPTVRGSIARRLSAIWPTRARPFEHRRLARRPTAVPQGRLRTPRARGRPRPGVTPGRSQPSKRRRLVLRVPRPRRPGHPQVGGRPQRHPVGPHAGACRRSSSSSSPSSGRSSSRRGARCSLVSHRRRCRPHRRRSAERRRRPCRHRSRRRRRCRPRRLRSRRHRAHPAITSSCRRQP